MVVYTVKRQILTVEKEARKDGDKAYDLGEAAHKHDPGPVQFQSLDQPTSEESASTPRRYCYQTNCRNGENI